MNPCPHRIGGSPGVSVQASPFPPFPPLRASVVFHGFACASAGRSASLAMWASHEAV